MTIKRRYIAAASVALAIFLASCAPRTVQPGAPTDAPTVATEAPSVTVPSATQAPSATMTTVPPTSSPTPAPTETLTLAPTETATSIPTASLAPTISGEEVEGLAGTIRSNPTGAQFDDYFQPLDDPETHYGIDSLDDAAKSHIAALRDSNIIVRVWGTLIRDAMDVNGTQLQVTRLEAGEILVDRADGWEGTLVKLPAGNQLGSLFRRQDGREFSFSGANDAINAQLGAYLEAGQTVRVWGQVTASNNHITIEQVTVVGSGAEGWQGQLKKLPAGNQYGSVFQRQDGTEFTYDAGTDELRAQLANYLWTGEIIQVWGSVNTSNNHLTVERVELAPGPVVEPRNLAALGTASASSSLPSDTWGSYGPASAIDGALSTTWAEGVSGPGVGEWIMLTFERPIEVTSIGLDVGYDRDPNDAIRSADLFTRNNRIKRVTVQFSSGESLDLTLQDERGVQVAPVVDASKPGIETTSVKVIIQDVYRGSQYNDTCLAELQVWGRGK